MSAYNSTESSNQATRKLQSPPFPIEVQIKIIEFMFLPQQLCPKHIFSLCFDIWSCPYGRAAHPDHNDTQTIVTPNRQLSSVCHMFLHEGHKAFFTHHLFVFNQYLHHTERCSLKRENRRIETTHDVFRYRDSRATRLLDFIDQPHWRGRGSFYFQHSNSYSYVDRYRYQIRHLSLGLKCDWWHFHKSDWDWSLKVDWQTLPSLETLYVDLRLFMVLRSMWRQEFGEDEGRQKLEDAARRMKCLNLKKLVFVGCSILENSVDEPHRSYMRTLFKSALANTGKIDFWDQYEGW